MIAFFDSLWQMTYSILRASVGSCDAHTYDVVFMPSRMLLTMARSATESSAKYSSRSMAW